MTTRAATGVGSSRANVEMAPAMSRARDGCASARMCVTQ
jgi:hypothetical protein